MAAALAALVMAVSPAAAGGGSKGRGRDPRVIHPRAGKANAELAAEWWQWALSIPFEQNPIADTNGTFSAVGQSGEVWFLAGTFGGPAVTRTCDVPAGKELFFPILNTVWVHFPPWHPYPDPPFDEELEAAVRADQDAWIGSFDPEEALACVIDGVPVTNLGRYRVQSPKFAAAIPEGGLVPPPGVYGPCVTDGYYLRLVPLGEGEHTISFAVSGMLEVHYVLNVVDVGVGRCRDDDEDDD